MPSTLIFGPAQGACTYWNRASQFYEEDVFCLASSGLYKWQEKYLGSQKPTKEYGIPENAGREKEETDKGNEVASNINLVFLEEFCGVLVISLAKSLWPTGNEISHFLRDNQALATPTLVMELQGLPTKITSSFRGKDLIFWKHLLFLENKKPSAVF